MSALFSGPKNPGLVEADYSESLPASLRAFSGPKNPGLVEAKELAGCKD